jgi:RNA polymerase sigma-70 factor (ECF subfamily)
MRAAIAALPEPTRTIYLAHLVKGLDYRTIGALEGISVREVERHIADAILLVDRHLRAVGPRR